MSGSRCTACASRSVAAIDAAITNGESKSGIARRYGISRFAVTRHAEHLVPGILVEGVRPVVDGGLRDLDGRLVALEGVLQAALDQAIASGKTTALLAASKEVRQTIEALARLRGQLDERPVVNVLQIPEFRTATQVLLRALEPYPEARVAAAHALSTFGGEA